MTWPVRVRLESPSSRRASPKFCDARLIVRVDEHVGGFQVAVQDASFVRVMNRVRDGLDVSRRAFGRQRLAVDEFCEVRPVHIIHNQKMLVVVDADFVNGDDVRMLQTPCRHRLNAKASDGIGVCHWAKKQKLHGNNPL